MLGLLGCIFSHHTPDVRLFQNKLNAKNYKKADMQGSVLTCMLVRRKISAMRYILAIFILVAAASLSAQEFTLKVDAFDTNNRILEKHAFCAVKGHGANISPAISWNGAPVGTQSFVILMYDPDVPTDFSKAGKKGVEIESEQPRQIFYHWVLADIPASVTSLAEGAEGKGVKKNRFKAGKAPVGLRGLNSYTEFTKKDRKLKGAYAGYDGPCPPANDARLHRYVFTVYALNVPSLNLPKNFTGEDVMKAIKGKVLSQARLKGEYTLNPRLKK